MSINSLKNIQENFDEIKNDVYTIKLEGKEYIVIRKDSKNFKSLLEDADNSDTKTINNIDDKKEDEIIKKLDEENDNSRKMMWIMFGIGGLFLLIFIILVFRYLFSSKKSEDNVDAPIIEPPYQEKSPNILNIPSPPIPPRNTSPKPITSFESEPEPEPPKSSFSFFKKNNSESLPKQVSLSPEEINNESSPKFSSFNPNKDISNDNSDVSRKSLLTAMRSSNNSKSENKSIFDSLFKKNDKTPSLDSTSVESNNISDKIKGGKRKYTRRTYTRRKSSVKKK